MTTVYTELIINDVLRPDHCLWGEFTCRFSGPAQILGTMNRHRREVSLFFCITRRTQALSPRPPRSETSFSRVYRRVLARRSVGTCSSVRPDHNRGARLPVYVGPPTAAGKEG